MEDSPRLDLEEELAHACFGADVARKVGCACVLVMCGCAGDYCDGTALRVGEEGANEVGAEESVGGQLWLFPHFQNVVLRFRWGRSGEHTHNHR